MAMTSDAVEASRVIAKCLPFLFKPDARAVVSTDRPRIISVLMGLWKTVNPMAKMTRASRNIAIYFSTTSGQR